MRARWLQAEAKVLVANGPMLANGSFIAIPEASGGANDAGSVANSPHDTPSVTPTKHIQHKVFSVLSLRPCARADLTSAIHCSRGHNSST